jgi:hypothetical protein
VSDTGPQMYRTELCLATNGDWYLLRGGIRIGCFPADPDGVTVTGTIAARGWARTELKGAGVTVTGWVNGTDAPPQDSGYWLAEPENEPEHPIDALYDVLNTLSMAVLAVTCDDTERAESNLWEASVAEPGAFPAGSDEAKALAVLIGAIKREARVTP